MSLDEMAIEYDQQQKDNYCGPACAQMVLDSMGDGPVHQPALYGEIRQHNSKSHSDCSWSSRPEGLAGAMNAHAPAGGGVSFVPFAASDEPTTTRKIIWTVHNFKNQNAAPVALVSGGSHWVVVRGFDASAAPAGPGDTSYTITTLYINDPAAGGGTDLAVPYLSWQLNYMFDVDCSGDWNGKYVAVCDQGPAGPLTPAGRRVRDTKATKGPVTSRKPSEKQIDVVQVTDIANRSAETEWFRAPKFQKVLRATKAAQPYLVKRLDREGGSYYIVPMQRPESAATPAAITIDASAGTYNEAILRDEAQKLFQVSPERAAELLATTKIEFSAQPPTLVWKPCRESLTPLRPFYLFTQGTSQIYVRTDDGGIFTKLHDEDRGL